MTKFTLKRVTSVCLHFTSKSQTNFQLKRMQDYKWDRFAGATKVLNQQVDMFAATDCSSKKYLFGDRV